MFSRTISLLAVGVVSLFAAVQADSVGYVGTLSSLDGGLGGVVRVVNATALEITSYTLKDASAPALYWWGTTDGVIKNGFRISNTQVTEAAKTNVLQIKLDAGKTAADFTTVGLWCERLSANFGQATLKAPTAAAGSSSAMTTAASATASATMSGSTAAQTSAKSAASTFGAAFGVMIAAASFVVWMV